MTHYAPYHLSGPGFLPPYKSHRRRRDDTTQVTVKELVRRIFHEQSGARTTRQSVFPGDGSPPYLEQIDIYGRTTHLGRLGTKWLTDATGA